MLPGFYFLHQRDFHFITLLLTVGLQSLSSVRENYFKVQRMNFPDVGTNPEGGELVTESGLSQSFVLVRTGSVRVVRLFICRSPLRPHSSRRFSFFFGKYSGIYGAEKDEVHEGPLHIYVLISSEIFFVGRPDRTLR